MCSEKLQHRRGRRHTCHSPGQATNLNSDSFGMRLVGPVTRPQLRLASDVEFCSPTRQRVGATAAGFIFPIWDRCHHSRVSYPQPPEKDRVMGNGYNKTVIHRQRRPVYLEKRKWVRNSVARVYACRPASDCESNKITTKLRTERTTDKTVKSNLRYRGLPEPRAQIRERERESSWHTALSLRSFLCRAALYEF